MIAIHALGHGLSKDTGAPWSFEQMPAMADAIGGNIAKSPLTQMYPDVDWSTLNGVACRDAIFD